MKCPHCRKVIHFDPEDGVTVYTTNERERLGYAIEQGNCPACSNLIVLKRDGKIMNHDYVDSENIEVLYPKYYTREAPPQEVPTNYSIDFIEAANVLPVSAKASAAISRRLLQQVLEEVFQIKKSSLADQIEAFLALKDVPTYLTDSIDAVRNIGNLAAHPLKDKQTGLVVSVEPGEADWLLEVLELLFDFCFVQPQKSALRKQALNEKLIKLGKPSMK